ncbi:hypothetical protein ANCCEY_13822 [Ancylostoma ceylanicum]|uniref:Uncharacterized protein n=1 Tax=Ancylostoma ceylanicum TaxID=53326 RepID=A0A0D6LB96_9BILA|nr:hypothetical protein ANCCEY_13822 [Ancylostoma ceylanicum]
MSVPVALSYQVEPHISTWLEWMRAETETSSRPALARDLLYVGLGIVGGRSEAICSYFAETLRLQKVYVHQRQLDQWKTLFINSCLSEADLTSWMQEQLVDLALPIHSHLADLTIRFAIEAAQKNVTGLSPQFVENVFVGEILDESKLTVRILVLLYLLCYRTKKNAVKGEETWPIEMIRPLVECVPSMFVATEFIQEMLALPDLKRRIFAVCLMAEVGRKYRLPESAASLNLVMDVLNTLLKYAQMPGNHALFTAITPSLGNIIPVFPSLAPLVSTLLLRISSVTRTQLAMNCLDVRPQGSRERKLANAVERVLASRLKVAD